MSKLDFKTAKLQEEAYLRLLYPEPKDIPGCISLFDTYISCGAIRSQVKSVYRYGERQRCTDKWEDVKFCMSLKSLHPEEQREALIDRRAAWWATRRMSRSSEDVWDIRDEPLKTFPKPITYEPQNTNPIG